MFSTGKSSFNQYRPPIGHKMGYCTCRYSERIKCPNCGHVVWKLHQPFLRKSEINVCAFCFDDVQKAGIDKIEN